MNKLTSFHIEDFNTICDFIRENPFGILISNSASLEPIASHIPFQLEDCDDEIVLYGHLSKFNRQNMFIRDGKHAMIIFQGPHAYISSGLYGHVNVPTWNYQAVHLHGNIEFLTNEQVDQHLRELLEAHESKRKDPISYDRIPTQLIESYKKDIIAFRFITYKSEGIFKLSQNRNDDDFRAITEDLATNPLSAPLAAAMRKLR